MAIFSRRILQRMINENAEFLLEGQTKKHVRQLNRMPVEQTLAYEWEVVILNALGKAGKIAHERSFGGRSKADIYFESFDNPEANFVADITAISDKGMDAKNPYEALSKQLYERVRDAGLRGNSFRLAVGTRPDPVYNGAHEVQLNIPGEARFSQIIFGKKFDAFIGRIAKSPQAAEQYRLKTDDADIEIFYNPNQRYASGSYASYTELHSLTENTIYHALEDKASQLLGTGFRGPLGIFLCDGGSSHFRKELTAGLSYSFDEVINHFLSNHEDIYFVVTFTTGRKSPYGVPPYRDNPFINHVKFYGGHKFRNIGFNILEILESVSARIPPFPETEPHNALYWIRGKDGGIGRSNLGGMEVSAGPFATKIKISARALLELLAGKISQKDFLEAHRFIPSHLFRGPTSNHFENALNRGQLINDVSIERSETEDDDWVTFELRGSDPAISAFRVPEKTEGKEGRGQRKKTDKKMTRVKTNI